jgi:hypothetical protein
MAKPILTKAKIHAVATESVNAVNEQLPHSPSLQQLTTPRRRNQSERAGQLLRLLLSSADEKVRLAVHFFANLEQRLASNLTGMTHDHFGFADAKSFADYVKMKIIAMEAKTDNIAEFKKGMKGRKWWFIGSILFERYIKYGPVRKFLDDTARDVLDVINKRIESGSPYKMVDFQNQPVGITERFGRLSAGLEFILETADGQKAYLDFGHIAFNQKGYWTLPTPTEIKLPWAAGRVTTQFSEFVPRLKDAKKLVVKFEKSDLENLKKQVGNGIVRLDEVDGLIHAEIQPGKLVFDPLARNQMVVKPGLKEWGEVKDPSNSPDINLGVGTTTRGFQVANKKERGFFYWKAEVDISRTSFEKLYEIIFLGRN